MSEENLILHQGSGGAAYNLCVLCFLSGSELELATGASPRKRIMSRWKRWRDSRSRWN